jgi:hypothetical protein
VDTADHRVAGIVADIVDIAVAHIVAGIVDIAPTAELRVQRHQEDYRIPGRSVLQAQPVFHSECKMPESLLVKLERQAEPVELSHNACRKLLPALLLHYSVGKRWEMLKECWPHLQIALAFRTGDRISFR